MLDSITSVAPARICLYGDHQDYLNLPVIAIAIDRYIKVEAKSTLAEAFYINKLDINKKDIIDYNNQKMKSRIILPHPRMHERNFVLLPLYELNKVWIHPILKQPIKKLILSLSNKDIRSIKQI